MPTILNACYKGKQAFFCSFLIISFFPLLISFSPAHSFNGFNGDTAPTKLATTDTIGIKGSKGYRRDVREWKRRRDEVEEKYDSIYGAIVDTGNTICEGYVR
jgi:hypothetical protein